MRNRVGSEKARNIRLTCSFAMIYIRAGDYIARAREKEEQILKGTSNGVSTTLLRRVVAEAVGTALLLAAIVGSGIMAERLAGGSAAIALLANTLATGGALVAILLALGPVSGAHLNPAVTLAEAWRVGTAR